MSAIYNLRTIPNGWQVNKFGDDFNLESSYEMTSSDGVVRCGCPAGARPTCRHRQMFPKLLTRLDTAWFLDFDTKQWVDPTGEASEVSSSGPEIASYVELPEGSTSEEVAEAFSKLTTLKQPDHHPFRRRM